MRYVSPEAPITDQPSPGVQRILDARHIRLGILDNSKANSDHLLKLIAEGLGSALPLTSLVWLRKTSASRAADQGLLQKLSQETDCTISAMAD